MSLQLNPSSSAKLKRMHRPFAFLMICAGSLFAQEALLAQEAPPPGPPPGGGGRGRGVPAPKNLQILKPEEIRATMAAFVQGTGLACDGCHVQGDRASDDKHEKVVARKMLEMVRGINANTFNGENKVTCYTCHRGEAHPQSAPPVQ
jgi:photosynthetic reaction center cytochrome c subunit